MKKRKFKLVIFLGLLISLYCLLNYFSDKKQDRLFESAGISATLSVLSLEHCENLSKKTKWFYHPSDLQFCSNHWLKANVLHNEIKHRLTGPSSGSILSRDFDLSKPGGMTIIKVGYRKFIAIPFYKHKKQIEFVYPNDPHAMGKDPKGNYAYLSKIGPGRTFEKIEMNQPIHDRIKHLMSRFLRQ